MNQLTNGTVTDYLARNGRDNDADIEINSEPPQGGKLISFLLTRRFIQITVRRRLERAFRVTKVRKGGTSASVNRKK